MTGVFHSGEKAVQRQTGGASTAAKLGASTVQPFIPSDFVEFLAAQHTVDGPGSPPRRRRRDTKGVPDLNVLGGPLEACGTDPITGFFRDGCCSTGPEDRGSHTICAVVTAEFLEHQRQIGNDLITAMPEYRFPGLVPGDRWCVTAANWLQAHIDGAAAFVVLASTHQRALEIVPLEALREHAVDVPSDPGALQA